MAHKITQMAVCRVCVRSTAMLEPDLSNCHGHETAIAANTQFSGLQLQTVNDAVTERVVLTMQQVLAQFGQLFLQLMTNAGHCCCRKPSEQHFALLCAK